MQSFQDNGPQLSGAEEPLAPYASSGGASRGRRYPEASPRYRSEYQRDRDRIIHSAAFRRLEYKTQVFVNHEGDLFRTRLTHSLEVAQIARSIARALRLNEDLTETIALAHDLGHPPFGHAGQDILNRCMREFGGFEHNLQSLRVVDELEERYVEFPGLNLTFESREGILKHCSLSNAKRLGALGVRFLNKMQPGLEAQLVNLADEISYVCHDLDDGLRAGVLDVEQTCSQRQFARTYEELANRYPNLDQRRLIHETIRRLVDYFVTHLIENCHKGLKDASPKSPDEVRAWGYPLIEHDDAVRKELQQLKIFLYNSLYMHDRVAKMREEATVILENLFALFMDSPRNLPEQELRRSERLYEELGISGRARAVTDYIAGMTDRYAAQEYRRLGGVDETH